MSTAANDVSAKSRTAEDTLAQKSREGDVISGGHLVAKALKSEGVDTIYHMKNARGGDAGREGYRLGKTLGGYVHLHFASCPEFAGRIFEL